MLTASNEMVMVRFLSALIRGVTFSDAKVDTNEIEIGIPLPDVLFFAMPLYETANI
jgi:hypothetical protein